MTTCIRSIGRRSLQMERLEPRYALAQTSLGNWTLVAQSSDPNNGPVLTPLLPPGASVTPVGEAFAGNVIAFFYQLTPVHAPQIVALQTNGFYRQTADSTGFYTSLRQFGYFSSNDQSADVSTATALEIVREGDSIRVRATYRNDHASSGDKFLITADYLIQPPTAFLSSTLIDVVITNESGRAVIPAWPGHPANQEQWKLAGLSSMYVADRLQLPLPAWYPALDPDNDYVNLPKLGNDNPLDDGISRPQTLRLEVSTHDVKRIEFDAAQLNLEHGLPYLDEGFGTSAKLVQEGAHSTKVTAQHLYDAMRNHRLEVQSASGLIDDVASFNWSTTYNQEDANMVDGDNVQIRLGADQQVNAWPAGGVQRLSLRLQSGAGIGRPAYQNPLNRLDVNRDKRLTAFDALLVINELNLRGAPYTLPAPPSGYYTYLDVTGNGTLTSFDALLVINELNLNPTGGGGEAISGDDLAEREIDYLFALWTADADRRRLVQQAAERDFG